MNLIIPKKKLGLKVVKRLGRVLFQEFTDFRKVPRLIHAYSRGSELCLSYGRMKTATCFTQLLVSSPILDIYLSKSICCRLMVSELFYPCIFLTGTYDYYGMNHYTSRMIREALPDEELTDWPFGDAPDLHGKTLKADSWDVSVVYWFYVST